MLTRVGLSALWSRPLAFSWTFDHHRRTVLSTTKRAVTQSQLLTRRWVSTAQETESTNVGHSRFLAEALKDEKWKDRPPRDTKWSNNVEWATEDFDTAAEGRGKLSPTASHLFKLILPLGSIPRPGPPSADDRKSPPTVFLLHPSQPLSHVGRLILASLAPATPTISFRSTSARGRPYEWSDSTDVADFIRDAARSREFRVCVSDPPTKITVDVPTFADRTRFLRRRLSAVEVDLEEMEALKRSCDREAHRGARRMAVGGFGILVVYWGAVARLTFWDYGWDVMEPITYLSGLSIAILGYLWFLYQGREVSYSSLLHHSVSSRREVLYRARGLDIERWLELVSEAKGLRREIGKIAEDYDERRWKERERELDERLKEEREQAKDVESTVTDPEVMKLGKEADR